MLTRQQAKDLQIELCDSCLRDEALELIDDVYDSFDKQTCGNCKFDRSYTRICEAYVGRPAYEDSCFKHDETKDFSCKKWEQK